MWTRPSTATSCFATAAKSSSAAPGAATAGSFVLRLRSGGDGGVQGVRVINHQETPGFGDILDTPSAWLQSFRTGDVHAVTGATVTSQAVMLAVERIAGRVDLKALCPS